MYGSTPIPTTDPNDRLARIEAKLDELAKWNRWLVILVAITLLVTITSLFIV